MPQVFQSGWYTDSEGVRRYGIDPAQFDNPTPNQPTPPAPETPNTPANAYAGVLGSETPEEKAAREFRERQGNEYQTAANQTIDEEAIRLATERRFQAEIDSLNRVYAEKKNQERLRGKGRLGTDTAIQSRRGLIGSTFGEAQTGKVEDANVQAEEAINDELSFELSQVRAKIRKEASDEVLAKRKAKAEGADSYMTYLAEQAERSRTKVASAAQRLLAVASKTGTDINWGSTEIADIAKSLKISVEELKNNYEDEKANQEAAAQEAKIKSYQKLGKGESLIDPATGLPVYSPEKEVEPLETQVVDGNLLERQADGTWKTIYAKPADVDKPLTEKERIELEIKRAELRKLGYDIDQNGDVVQATDTVDPQKVQNATNVISQINDILNSKGFKGAVGAGWSSLFGLNPPAGTNAAATKSKVEALIGSETLKNMGLIKGVLSDRDMAILQLASTGGLNTKMKESDFKDTIDKLKNASWSVVNHPKLQIGEVMQFTDNGEQLYSYKNNDGTVYTGKEGDGYQDLTTPRAGSSSGGDDLDALLDELSFSKDPNKSVNGSSNVKKIASAIGQFESGGNYKAQGPVVTSGMYKGDRAYGKYQIMSKNLPQWSKEALGRSITLKEFLNNPQLQDRIAEYKMGKIYQQYGNVGDVASVWFSGRPVNKAGNAKDVLGTTVPNYVKNVIAIHNRLG